MEMKRRWLVFFSALLLTIDYAQTGVCWTVQQTVADQKGQPVRADVNIQISGSGFGRSTDSSGHSSNVNLPPDANGCTLRVMPIDSCYRGGFKAMSSCAYLATDTIGINWTVSENDDPTVAISRNGKIITESRAIGEYPAPRTIAGTVKCVVNSYAENGGPFAGGRPVSGIAIKAIDESGNVLGQAVTGSDGKYKISFVRNCKHELKRMVLDPQNTPYQGGMLEGWSACSYWMVYTKYPPLFQASSCIRDGVTSGRAKAVNGSAIPESETLDCAKPPPKGSMGLPPCLANTGGCI